MSENLGAHVLRTALRELRQLKTLGGKAMAQVSDEEFFMTIDPESNSLAIIVRHLAGNMRSRWTDFLTSDGEKPNRHRDLEFEILGNESRDEIFRQWEQGWQCLFGALETLTAKDLDRAVTIRGEPHTVPQAIFRQLAHYAEHVGQIVFVAKHLRSREWRTLSVPRGKSAEFLAAMKRRFEK